MSQYLFTCCNRMVEIDASTATQVTLPHLCIGDVTAIGVANAVINPNAYIAEAAGDDTTEVVFGGQVLGTDGGTAMNGDGQ
jgi:hypothetical protein